MTKKILFLLTFLLTTLGGGNFALAVDETFSVLGVTEGSPQTINGTNWGSENVALSSATASVALTIGGGSSNWTLASDKITGKNSSASLTFQANKNGLLVINLTKNSGKVKCLRIKRNGSEQEVKLVDVNSSPIGYDSSKHGYKITDTSCPIVVKIDAEADVDYTIDFDGFGDWSFSSFTFDLETIDNIYSNSYPYTWKFNVEAAKWTKSKSQITDNTTKWVVMSNGKEARNRVTTPITVNDIDICKGLTFQADVASANASSTSGRICLDWTYCQLWMNGTVTIPNLTVGQTITFESLDDVQGDAAVVRTTGNTFTVETAGPATFTVNNGYIKSISVSKALRTLSFDELSYTINYGATGVSHIPTPSPATGATITYSSSDTNVATVNENTGVITTVNSGTCEITATAAETETYAEATASYTLTVEGTQTPTLAWSSSNGFTDSGGDYKAADLPYGNHKFYTAYVLNADGSGVKDGDIRYGLVEEYEGYLTIDASSGKIEPTRKFADKGEPEKEVQVYAYIPGSGTRNPAPRITYKVKIVKGTFSGNLFKQTYLTVNKGCTIAPQNNVQSMRWDDIEAITVNIKDGSSDNAVSGPGTDMVTDYKADTSNKTLYFDTKTKDDVEIVDWFYPVFHGKAVGEVTFTVTLQSKLYGDHQGEFTLHVIPTDEHTGFAWASETRKYTIYEGDYMLLPEVTGSTNGNFSYSSGYDNQKTHHKYVYTRRWDGTQYVTTYNNKNFHKGEGFPNFDLTDAEGNTVTEVQADGNNVALLFWNTGTGTENDRLLIYGNKAGKVYLKAFDPQITDRALSTIEIEVKSKTDINADFESLKSSMTFPYTWDFTTDYDWSAEIETGTGNWIQDGSTYDLGMSSNINYDYADEDNDGIVWGNDNDDPTTDSNALTDKLLVGTNDKVLRGFAGIKIRLGNSGKGSWYSKRDGIHILPYTNSNTPRLRVTTGTHTLILPTPTGANCPATFKVFVKVKALEAGEGTLWVRIANIDRNASGQNSYYNFKNAAVGEDIIYSVDATKDTPLELDLDKVDVYWIAYSTEVKNVVCPRDANGNLNYAAASYSYPEDLDLSKSAEVNSGVTAYYASKYGYNAAAVATGTEGFAVVMTEINTPVPANTGLILKKNTTDASTSCYMIANGKNVASYTEPESLTTNYLKATPAGGGQVSSNETISSKTYTNFTMAYAYKMYRDPMDAGSAYTGYLFDRDWSFYRIMGDVYFSPQKSYLQIPGNLYVDRDGNIVDGAASRRAADDNRPSTKPMLDIIFEDEPSGDHNVTGITSVSDRIIDNDAWYTLQGIRVDAPAKGGIYIHNGRKVVIK